MKKVAALCSPDVFQALQDVGPDFNVDVHHVGVAQEHLDLSQLVDCVGLIIELGPSDDGEHTPDQWAKLPIPVAGLPVTGSTSGPLNTQGVSQVLWGPSDVAAWVLTLPEEPAAATVAGVGSSQPGGGGVITVWGPAGAPGRTTIAITVAVVLAQAQRPVVLVDADVFAPSVATLLGLSGQSSGLLGVCRMARANTLNVDNVMDKAEIYQSKNLSLPVLTGLGGGHKAHTIEVLSWEKVLDVLVEAGFLVVVDVSSGLSQQPGEVIGGPSVNGVTRSALKRSDYVLSVLTPHPVSVVRWLLDHERVTELATKAHLEVIINHVTPIHKRALEETRHTLWEYAGVSHTTLLPLDQDLASRVSMPGQAPVLPSTEPLLQTLGHLLDSLLGSSSTPAKPLKKAAFQASDSNSRKKAWTNPLSTLFPLGVKLSKRGITLKG